MAAGRDKLGIVHWCAFFAGLLMIGTACGDVRNLRCLLYAGVITGCGSAFALVTRWGFRGQVPGSVTLISDAPSVLELACENNLRIEELELRADIGDFRADEHETRLALVFSSIAETIAEAGYSVPGPGSIAARPKLSLVSTDRLQAG
jgi:hypothetical protein